MSRIAAGTKCEDCRCCDATDVLAGEPLCRACKLGMSLCEKKRASGNSPVAQMEALEMPRDPATEAQDTDWRARNTHGGARARVSEATIAAIRAEPSHLRNCAIARKYSVSEPTVGKYRRSPLRPSEPPGARRKACAAEDRVREAILAAPGDVPTGELAKRFGMAYTTVYYIRKSGQRAAKQGPEKEPDVKEAVGEDASLEARGVDAEAGIALEGESATLTLKFSAEQLDAIWDRLSLDVKATAIRAVLQAWV